MHGCGHLATPHGTPEENFFLIHHDLIEALRKAGHRPETRAFQTEYGPDLKLFCARCAKRWPGAAFHRFFGLSPRRECGR
jgi:hypothetical protein